MKKVDESPEHYQGWPVPVCTKNLVNSSIRSVSLENLSIFHRQYCIASCFVLRNLVFQVSNLFRYMTIWINDIGIKLPGKIVIWKNVKLWF